MLLEVPLLAFSLVLLTGCESGSNTDTPDAHFPIDGPASVVENTTPPDAHFETTPVVRKPRRRRRVAPRKAPRAPVRSLAHGPTLPLGAFAVDSWAPPAGSTLSHSPALTGRDYHDRYMPIRTGSAFKYPAGLTVAARRARRKSRRDAAIFGVSGIP
jgi:hypothetical protein